MVTQALASARSKLGEAHSQRLEGEIAKLKSSLADVLGSSAGAEAGAKKRAGRRRQGDGGGGKADGAPQEEERGEEEVGAPKMTADEALKFV